MESALQTQLLGESPFNRLVSVTGITAADKTVFMQKTPKNAAQALWSYLVTGDAPESANQ